MSAFTPCDFLVEVNALTFIAHSFAQAYRLARREVLAGKSSAGRPQLYGKFGFEFKREVPLWRSLHHAIFGGAAPDAIIRRAE